MDIDMKFEEAIRLLEDAVAVLENGNMGLDEAIATYEEAMKLVRVCNSKLEQAEQKVKILVEGADGTVSDRPFEENET